MLPVTFSFVADSLAELLTLKDFRLWFGILRGKFHDVDPFKGMRVECARVNDRRVNHGEGRSVG
jgi:hypothetical protein